VLWLDGGDSLNAHISFAPADVGGASAEAQSAQLSPEEQRRRAQFSQRISAAFGDVVSILMRTRAFKHHTLADLEWMVVPALTTGQFSLAQAQSKAHGAMAAVGVVLWASVSDEVDQRLSQSSQGPTRLRPDEWRSGTHIWVVDGIGDRRVIAAQLKKLRDNEWKGQTVKIKVRGQDGAPTVRVLQAN